MGQVEEEGEIVEEKKETEGEKDRRGGMEELGREEGDRGAGKERKGRGKLG